MTEQGIDHDDDIPPTTFQRKPLTHAIPWRTDTLGLASRICFHSASCFCSAFVPIVPNDSPVTPNICILIFGKVDANGTSGISQLNI